VGFSVKPPEEGQHLHAHHLDVCPAGGREPPGEDYDLTTTPFPTGFFSDTLKSNGSAPPSTYDFFKAHPTWFTTSDAATYQFRLTNSKFFEETISAAYVRGDVKFLENKLWVVGGVRFERTADFGQGPLDDLRATFKQDASGNLLKGRRGRISP